MTREQVYEMIDKERDYQDEKWGGKEHDKNNSVGDFIIYMDVYLKKAKEQYTSATIINGPVNELRKVIALGVACFEQLDDELVPQREMK